VHRVVAKSGRASLLERELCDVVGAAELVRSGRAHRAEVCSLRYASRVLRLAQRRYAEVPLMFRAIPREGSTEIDILIERTSAEVTA
jgi:hypothetical protein